MSISSLEGKGLRSASRPRLSPRVADCGSKAFLNVPLPLDLVSSPEFLAQARSVCKSCRCLVVDLSQAEYLDSAGVRALLALRQELEQAEKELRLVIPSGSRAERTLKLLHLLEGFQPFQSLRDAWTHGPGDG